MPLSEYRLDILVISFVNKLKKRYITGSDQVAQGACQFLMNVKSSTRWQSPKEFIALIISIGQCVVKTQPHEFAAGNALRTVSALVRGEMSDSSASSSEDNAPVNTAMFHLLVPPPDK